MRQLTQGARLFAHITAVLRAKEDSTDFVRDAVERELKTPGTQGGCAYRKSNPHILVMQSTQDGTAEYATNDLDSARDRRILVQGQMRARLIVVVQI